MRKREREIALGDLRISEGQLDSYYYFILGVKGGHLNADFAR